MDGRAFPFVCPKFLPRPARYPRVGVLLGYGTSAPRFVPLPQKRRETATALYETVWHVARRLLRIARATLEVLLSGLKWVGGVALLVVASVLLVYLGAVLLARWGVWAFYP